MTRLQAGSSLVQAGWIPLVLVLLVGLVLVAWHPICAPVVRATCRAGWSRSSLPWLCSAAAPRSGSNVAAHDNTPGLTPVATAPAASVRLPSGASSTVPATSPATSAAASPFASPVSAIPVSAIPVYYVADVASDGALQLWDTKTFSVT